MSFPGQRSGQDPAGKEMKVHIRGQRIGWNPSRERGLGLPNHRLVHALPGGRIGHDLPGLLGWRMSQGSRFLSLRIQGMNQNHSAILP